VDKFGEIYGRRHVVYNVHSLNHLASDAQRYGVLDNFSCFEYTFSLQQLFCVISAGLTMVQVVHMHQGL